MTRALTRTEARRLLGVAPNADPSAVKRAYRSLAREHHPDLGGDPDTFHRLQLAYERLVGDLDGPDQPAVSRGQPSRPPVPFRDPAREADTTSVDWHQAPLADGTRLSRDRLAAWLAGPAPGPVTGLTAASRAPGSRLNRLAGSLSPELTSTLTIRSAHDDRGRIVVTIAVTGSNRRARRALDQLVLDEVWTRKRRSGTTELLTALTPTEDRRATAVRAVDCTAALLDELGWPLEAWRALIRGRPYESSGPAGR